MKFTKRTLFYSLAIIIVSYFLTVYQLPYYIYKPGGADELTPIVQVDGGYTSEGEMHLVTVSGGPASAIQYLWAKLQPHYEILPIEDVRPEGITDDEYMHAQLQMMENSQQSSTVVAYEAAKKEIKIDYNGVYVMSVLKNMPAENILEMADRIIGIDGNEINEAEDLINYINEKQAGDIVQLELIRNDEPLTKELTLETFENLDDKIGIGIQLVTDRDVTVNPEVNFSSGNIGGPSAGLMFALEIYDQLTEEDLTKGYQIVGTGEVDYSGNILRIGGIDKKVIAADREGCDIFFAPNENGANESNYQVAKETATEIKTDMKIVPVDTFEEALTYLQNLE